MVNDNFTVFQRVGFENLQLRMLQCKKGKGSPYSIVEHRVPELIQDLGSQPAGDVSRKPGRPPQPLRGLPVISLLDERGTQGRQRRGCDLNPGPTAPDPAH